MTSTFKRPPDAGGTSPRQVSGGVRLATDRGSASTELVLVTPLLLLLLLVAVAFGRMASARLLVDDAAHQAARAASLTRTAHEAQRQAHDVAGASLAASGASCTHVTVEADIGAPAASGLVRVRVACTTDLGVSGLPGRITVARTAVSVIDSYRGTP